MYLQHSNIIYSKVKLQSNRSLDSHVHVDFLTGILKKLKKRKGQQCWLVERKELQQDEMGKRICIFKGK